MSRALSFGLGLAMLGIAGVASADETPATATPKGTTVPTVFIHGRPMRPNVSITVKRVDLDATVRELRQPLVDRIGKSVDKSPF